MKNKRALRLWCGLLSAVQLAASAFGPVAAATFTSAQSPYAFTFPRDHGMHPAYRTEWWYFTGHLQATDGHRFGYELTIFRIGLAPGLLPRTADASRWRTHELFPAHFALSDVTGRSFYSSERIERGALGFAQASERRLAVHVRSWRVEMDSRGIIHLFADAQGRTIALALRSLKPIAVHGQNGVSRKGACAACASHYYSYTRLLSNGQVSTPTAEYAVRGLSWMDHEFSSSALAPDETGWDWFAFILRDGREVMLYRLRRGDGSTVPESSGTIVERNGRTTHLKANDFSIQALQTWTSPRTGAHYPSGWRVDIGPARLHVRVMPTLADQELGDTAGTPAYWEGDSVVESLSGQPLGQAYVELTGYSEALHF